VRALRAYNRTYQVDRKDGDPVVRGWLGGHHPDAQRLADHAARQYETTLQLTFSKRPWAAMPTADQQISGTAGLLWHVRFHSRSQYLRPRELWRDIEFATRGMLVHMLLDYSKSVQFTIPAVEDPTAVADAIGDLLDSVLTTSSWQPTADWDDPATGAPTPAPRDPRVLVDTPWNIVDDDTDRSASSAHEPPQRNPRGQ